MEKTQKKAKQYKVVNLNNPDGEKDLENYLNQEYMVASDLTPLLLPHIVVVFKNG